VKIIGLSCIISTHFVSYLISSEISFFDNVVDFLISSNNFLNVSLRPNTSKNVTGFFVLEITLRSFSDRELYGIYNCNLFCL